MALPGPAEVELDGAATLLAVSDAHPSKPNRPPIVRMVKDQWVGSTGEVHVGRVLEVDGVKYPVSNV